MWNLFSVQWQHRCGGKAAPGNRCDWCNKRLRADAHPRNHPDGWLPPGQHDDERRGEVFTFF